MTTQLLTSLKAPRRLAMLTALMLLTAASLSALWWPHVTSAATRLTAPDPVTAAWEKARAAGSYHFTSDVLQKTIPVASLTNVGRSSRSDALYLEGQNDLRAQTMELTLWSQGGSALNADSGVSLRTENGKTFTRRGDESWQESDSFVDGFAPQGDFLGYLAAIRNVTAGATETRSGVTFTPYRFTIDGPAFAVYMHEQMIAALRAKGELPPGIEVESPAYYRDMTGSGELWVGESGLPVRQILDLRFPEQNEERVEAAITVNFSNYGAEESGLWTLLRTGQWQGAWLVLPSRLPDLTGLWLGLTLSVVACLVVYYRRTRALQTAIVTAVIVSQVVGPLLSATSQSRFFDSYRAKAAAQEEQQAAATSERDIRAAVQAAPEFKPHQNPLENRDQQWEIERLGDYEIAAQSPNLSVSQSPSLQVTDPGTDTDGDTLSDFTEVRIGTSEVFSDTDEDGLNDDLEVKGFAFGGQTWYTDPDNKDTNRDGMVDLLEWGTDGNGALRNAPFNSDGDTLPDLFDPDNDNDGVADRVDSAPFTKGATSFDETNPLQLTVSNLTPNKPTFVEFQIRPQDPKNLWFAHNVLDWPLDSEGQMRDVDGVAYASVTGNSSDGREEHGDMKVVPMLEIRLPSASANLPPPAELTPFNITVNNFTADGSMKVAYVPLNLVSDEQTGERVAFSGQMRYLPTGSWADPHSVRLVWVVQVLNDFPCDPKDPAAVAQGCQSDGYIHNQPAMLHTYYDSWTLTGLTVREDHGAEMAIIYEDPAVDTNKQENAALVALSLALDSHLLKPQDANNDSVRDLKLSDLPARFDRDNNPSEAQRMAVAFECSLDNGVYTPCASPQNYSELSKGSHTFLVRAIDSRGLPDLSPAEFTWTVNAGQPDATITGKPANPTVERTATFTFSGDATATSFECSLDGSAYATCTSPQVYNNLGNGEHTFLVRARNSANSAGAADRYGWTVNNLVPVANNQTVVVIPNQAKGLTLTAIDNEPLLYTIVSPPTHGVLSGVAPDLSYAPNTNYGGVDSFTFKVSDGLAESNVATVTLFVDHVPPTVTCSVTPNNLWPPNHKLVNIQAAVTVTDAHSGPAGFTLLSVTSSEADSGLDAADVPGDIQN